MKASDWGSPRAWKGAAVGACAGLLLLFAVLSYSAALGKSATFDEPLHAVAGFVHRTMGDFRINPEDPALFGYWGSLGHGRHALTLNTNLTFWPHMLDDFATNQWVFAYWTLYRTPANDGDAFVQTSRFMFVVVGIGLGVLIAWWSWQLAGAWAAVMATALFAMDPNFMAHSALVKNDVMLSFMMVSLALALWRFGRRGTWLSLLGMTLAGAGAVNVKFSGVLGGPIILLALLIRSVLPRPWDVLGQTLDVWWKRVVVGPVVCLVVGVVSYVAIWGCYGFRFTPTSDPDLLLNTPRLIQRVQHNRFFSQTRAPGQPYTQDTVDREPLGPLADAVVWAESNRLLPQAWLHGFLFTHAMTLMRPSFLRGEVKTSGWWYYFPCAALFKTATATLLAIPLAAMGTALVWLFPRTSRSTAARGEPWNWICVGLPAVVYAGAAMTTNLNVGFRHILPVYPFLFVALGVAGARVMRWHVRAGAIAATVVVVGLGVESVGAYPNFIPFFNALSGGSGAGLRLLGDSNLDWGQDLKLLAAWQKHHGDRQLYLAYFGIADPKFHGVKATHLPFEAGGWPFAEVSQHPDGAGYLAISATTLQGMYAVSPAAQKFYREIQRYRPIAILGHSIYIYEWPPREKKS